MPSNLIIVNPAAGRGRVHRLWPQIERALHAAGVDFDFRLTRAPLEAQTLAESAAAAGYTAVVGVGGDGTLHEIANGLLNACGEGGQPGDVPALGAIPLGTGDDFAKNIPPLIPIGGQLFTWQASVKMIARGQTQEFDAGRLIADGGAPHYFLNSLDVGFGAAAVQNMKTIPAVLSGTAAYFMAALKTLWAYPLPTLRVQLDQQPPFETQVVILAVLNGRCFGNGFWATPQAEADDGWFDILYGERMGRMRILRLMVRMLRAAHLGQPGVHTGRARRLSIEASQPLAVEADGELPFLAARRLEVEVLPRRLRVIV